MSAFSLDAIIPPPAFQAHPNGLNVMWGESVCASLTSRGWFAMFQAPKAIREAIFSLPNTASAADIAAEANQRSAPGGKR